jgi:OOP family OmpA-OmpF porin
MNKTVVASALASALLSAGAAVAQDNPSGPYVGLGWGQFNIDVDDVGDVGDAVNDITKADDNAWKAFVGYRFNPYIAVEGAYVDLGSPGDRFDTSGSDGNYRVDIAGFAPSVIGSVPLGPVELFAKLGYFYYDVDLRVDLDDPGPDISSSHSESDWIYGAGVGFTLFEHLHLRAEYEGLHIDGADDADAIWLSGAWRF